MPKPSGSSLSKEIQTIRQSLSSITTALGRLAPFLDGLGATGSAKPVHRPRKLKLSPRRRAVLKLQGVYMTYVRALKPRQKARVKALKAAKGFPAAIALAKRLS